MNLPKYKYFLAINDFFSLITSFYLAGYFSSLVVNVAIGYPFQDFHSPLIVFAVASSVFVLIFQSNNLYKINLFLTRSKQLVSLVKSLLYGIAVLLILSFFFKFPILTDSRVFMLAFTSVIILVVTRIIILRRLYGLLAKKKILNRNILIVGAGKAGKLIATKILFENPYGIYILGFVDDSIPMETVIAGKIRVLGTVSDIHSIASRTKINEVIIAIDNINYDRILEIVDQCNNLEVPIKLASELFGIVPQKVFTESYNGIPIIEASPKINRKMSLFCKRIFDFSASLLALIILFPFFFILAIIIKITSRGPVFYTHTRIGKNGKPFSFYKFRSMTVIEGDDSKRKKMMLEFMKKGKTQSANDTKIINESRITAIGKFIRKTSIDELPQLINVIKGDMSLVGPRPCLLYEYENYDEWQKRRVLVLPGCTGLWQVSGRSNVSFTDSVVLDIYYINNMSPWLDLHLMLKTIPVMLLARGGK